LDYDGTLVPLKKHPKLAGLALSRQLRIGDPSRR
jgi:hypothetical protein